MQKYLYKINNIQIKNKKNKNKIKKTHSKCHFQKKKGSTESSVFGSFLFYFFIEILFNE